LVQEQQDKVTLAETHLVLRHIHRVAVVALAAQAFQVEPLLQELAALVEILEFKVSHHGLEVVEEVVATAHKVMPAKVV
jgi:hypothetical protein